MCNTLSCVHLLKKGQLEAARRLLLDCRNRDLELQGENKDGTALHWACSKGYSDMVDLLLPLGAQVNSRTKCGLTPLHCACGNGYVGVVRVLLEWGADVRAQSDSGDTPCHVAAYRGHPKVLCLLFEFGANPLVPNYQGRDALAEAIANHQSDVVDLLQRILSHRRSVQNSSGSRATRNVQNSSDSRLKVTVTSDPQRQLQYELWQEIAREFSLGNLR